MLAAGKLAACWLLLAAYWLLLAAGCELLAPGSWQLSRGCGLLVLSRHQDNIGAIVLLWQNTPGMNVCELLCLATAAHQQCDDTKDTTHCVLF